MDVADEFLIAGWVLLPYAATRLASHFLKRWVKYFAVCLSVACVGAFVAAYLVNQEHFETALLVVCGLVTGTIEQWVKVWKQKAKKPWIKR
jgi:hypothetical protein